MSSDCRHLSSARESIRDQRRSREGAGLLRAFSRAVEERRPRTPTFRPRHPRASRNARHRTL